MTTQITRIRQFDDSQILKKHSDGSTLSYSGPNLTTMLSGVTNPIYAPKRIDNPVSVQARDKTDFKTANFDTLWNVLIANPDRHFPR